MSTSPLKLISKELCPERKIICYLYHMILLTRVNVIEPKITKLFKAKKSRFLNCQQTLLIHFHCKHTIKDFSTLGEGPINCMTDSHSKLGFPNDTATY